MSMKEVVGDVRGGESIWGLGRKLMRRRQKTYFANSIKASVAALEQSFLTSKMFRGGEGHCRERRSLPLVSASVSI